MADSSKIIYPAVRRDESVIDDYHGCKVPEPYAWLEDPDSVETKEFVRAEDAITFDYLSGCDVREKFKNRMTELWDYPKYGCPFKEGSRYFHFYNTGLQNQSVMYVQNSLQEEAKVFLDPNKLSDDGTTAIGGRTFTEDGELFAYALSAKGSDWVTIKFMKVDGAVTLPDTLEKVKFTSMSWTHDNKGLFYNQYPDHVTKADGTETDSNLNQKLYYHYIGQDQSEDILCCEFPEHPKWHVGGQVSDCGDYILITPREGCEHVNRLFYCDLKALGDIKGKLPYVKVVDNFDAEYEYVTNQGTVFTFKTNLDSPNYKLVNIDFSNPKQENWSTLIPEDKKDVLEWASCVKENQLVLGCLHDVKSVLHLHSLDTGERLMTFPLDIGSITGFSGHKKQTEIFYQFTSFLTPGVIYHCDLSKEKPSPKVFREIVVKGFDSSLYQTDQVFYTSKDGTKIPMFIVHKKGINMDSSHPAFLYGYGGFSISITPSFSVSRITFIHNLGGILAIANIRGGQEYGETWHKGGIFGNKQNVFDDFQYAAKYLTDNGFTSSKKLTICGGSNGGLLVTACINQKPDMFACAIAQVPVTDMLKFHKFTIGHAWTTDFGCADKKEEFEWLIKYSPLHNIRIPDNGVQYPALLMLTADHDDRVVPLHSFKYIAELQHVMGQVEYQKNPLLIRIDTKAGHGFGKPTAKVIEEYADIFAFIARNVGATWRD